MKNQEITKRNAQSGSIFVWIFVMIALFGALSYAMMDGSRTGASTITRDRAKLAATNIIEYGTALRNAVRSATINGCRPEQISFENDHPQSDTYTNPNAPGDESCHIFSRAGGSMVYTPPESTILSQDPTVTSVTNTYGKLIFSGASRVEGIGTGAQELLMWYTTLDINICMGINDILGIENTGGAPPTDTTDIVVLTPFQGVFATGTAAGDTVADAGTFPAGKMSGCIHEQEGCGGAGVRPCYHFYQVLVTR